MPDSLIPTHGGYRRLRSFQLAQLCYDITVRFCDRYVPMRSRTHDQMVQAARSGVQNIAEGSKASGTSKRTELKLTNVARASLEELRLDYEDFLRQHHLPLWPRNHPLRRELIARRCTTADEVARWVKAVARRKDDGLGGLDGLGGPHGPPTTRSACAESIRSTKSIPSIKSTPALHYPALSANAALTLIAVASSLLDRQIASQAAAFEREGGFTERLHRFRLQARGPLPTPASPLRAIPRPSGAPSRPPSP